MSVLEKGITAVGAGYKGKSWNILGQVYYPKATCDTSPTGKLEALFEKIHGLTDPNEVVAIAAQHEVTFLPPEANA